MKEAASIFLRADIGTKDGYNLARWVRNEHVTRYLNEGAAAAQEVTELLESTPAYMLTYHFNQSGPFYMTYFTKSRSPKGTRASMELTEMQRSARSTSYI